MTKLRAGSVWLGLIVGTAMPALGQGDCDAELTKLFARAGVKFLPDSIGLVVHTQWLPRVQGVVASIVATWERDRTPLEARLIDTSSTPIRALTAVMLTAQDSSMVAWTLSVMLRGPLGGFSSLEQETATLVYEALHLPAEPAASVLEHPRSAVSAKTAALWSLRGSGNKTRIGAAIRACLCLLAARSEGVGQRVGAGVDWTGILSEDERHLIMSIGLFLRDDRELMSSSVPVLPTTNAVAKAMAQELNTAR